MINAIRRTDDRLRDERGRYLSNGAKKVVLSFRVPEFLKNWVRANTHNYLECLLLKEYTENTLPPPTKHLKQLLTIREIISSCYLAIDALYHTDVDENQVEQICDELSKDIRISALDLKL